MKSVLFVCTANRCRSPMAEAMFRVLAATQDSPADWLIASAGTWAEPGLPTMPLARETMQRRGLDVDGHRSRSIDPELMAAYSAIVVMTHGQQEALRVEFPWAASRIILLSALAGPAFDIDDPVGGTADDYEACAVEISQLLGRGFVRLLALATPSSPV